MDHEKNIKKINHVEHTDGYLSLGECTIAKLTIKVGSQTVDATIRGDCNQMQLTCTDHLNGFSPSYSTSKQD
jgi:hypothetical protein